MAGRNKVDISVVVACYKEAEHIRHSLPTLEDALLAMGLRYELIIIDDASPDATPVMLREMLHDRENVILRFHEKNQGRGATVQEGMLLATGEIVGFLDIDLEVGPWYILPVISEIRNNAADVVLGLRVYRVGIRPLILVRHFLSLGYRSLSRLILDIPYRDSEAGFKFFRREKLIPLLNRCEAAGWFWDTEIVYWAHSMGLAVKEIPVLFMRSPEKTSTVHMARDSWNYLWQLLCFRRKYKGQRRNT